MIDDQNQEDLNSLYVDFHNLEATGLKRENIGALSHFMGANFNNSFHNISD